MEDFTRDGALSTFNDFIRVDKYEMTRPRGKTQDTAIQHRIGLSRAIERLRHAHDSLIILKNRLKMHNLPA